MSARINHIKVVSPRPDIVDAFLREVCELHGGWAFGDAAPLPEGTPLGPGGSISRDEIRERRGNGQLDGFISGDSKSRQVQTLRHNAPAIWAVCLSTRDIEKVYERAQSRGVTCTTMEVADWNERDNVRNFFCLVEGILFEVIRIEPKAAAQQA